MLFDPQTSNRYIYPSTASYENAANNYALLPSLPLKLSLYKISYYYTQRKYSKIDKSLCRHRIFLTNLYFQTHLRSFIPIFSSSFHSPLSWSKEKQRNWIGYGRDKRRPLNRITPSIISCTESGRANALIVDLPSKILPSQKYDTSWTSVPYPWDER